MALLNWLTDRVYDTFYQDDKKRLAQSNAAYQQQVQAHQNRNVLSPQQYTQQLRGAAQNANNAVRYNAPAPRPQQPTPQIKKPTVNQATLTGRNLKTAAGMALTPGGAPLAPAALLGAFDKEGPFSAYHQQQFKNFTNPVTSKLQEYNDWVNKDDPTEGFQINSLGDWGRLGRTLLPSMALGLMEAPVKSAEAASGSGIRDDKKTDLTPLQRVGSGADAAITVGGLPYGGSGTFMKSLLPKTAKTLAPAGGNLLKTLASGTWNIAKDAGKEGVEEVVQTFASDLSDDSRVNTPLTQYRDAGVTGAAGGTLFSGAGKTIELTKSVPSRVDTSIHNNLSKNDPNYQSLLFEREYTTNNLEKTAIDQKLQQARQQVITQAPGKVVNKAKTDIESLQQIPHERTIQHPEVQAIAEQGNVLRQHRTDLMNRGLSYNSPAVKAVENAMRELGKDYNATYKRVYEQTKQEMLEPLIKANEFTRNHLIPGGTLGGPLAGDFSKAQEQDLIIKNGDGKAMSIDPLESLKQEALKYKSAEEFVKANENNQYALSKATGETWDSADVGMTRPEVKQQILTDFYNQAHTEAKAPKVVAPQATVAPKSSLENAITHYKQNPTGGFDIESYIKENYPDQMHRLEQAKQELKAEKLESQKREAEFMERAKADEKKATELSNMVLDELMSRPPAKPKLTDSQLADKGIELNKIVTRLEGEMRDGKRFTQDQIDKANELMTLSQRVFYEKDLQALKRAEEIAKELTTPKPTPQDAPEGKSTKTTPKPLGETQQQRVQRALDPKDKLQYRNLNAKEKVMYKEAKGASQQDAKQQSAVEKSRPTTKTSSPQAATAKSRSANNQPVVARSADQQSTKKPSSAPRPQQSSQSTQSRTDFEPRSSYVNDMTDEQAKQYVDQMSKQQKDARKRNSEGMKESASEAAGDFREKFIDDLAPIEDRLNKAIKKGAVVDPKDHITYQLDRTRRAEGIVHAYVRDSGLADIIQNVPNAKEFDQYLIAKHAKELDPEIMTGRDKAKDAALVKKLDGKYRDYAKRVYEYNQALLDKSVEYGLISKQTATDLKKKYPEYVPFNRVFNENELAKLSGVGGGEASLSSQSAVQRIKGSKRAIDSPLNSIIDKTRVVVEQGERNRAAKMLASYRNLPGNPFNLKRLPDNEAIGTRSSISYLENGKKVTYLTDKTIADAAKGMTRQQIGLWGRVLSAPTRLLRAGATTANAGFAGANIVKDVVGAAINSKNTISLGNPKVIGKALSAALHHNGKYYSELMREGVAGTSFDMYRNMPDLNIKEIRSHKNLATRAAHNANPKNWFRTVENTIGRSEDFGRAYQYYANKSGFERQGMDNDLAKLLAADEARHNSTNFFRHGTYGKNINLAIPYWNAGVQGARITARRLKERPVATLTKLGFTIAAPSAMIALNNYQDEERRKVIENIPDYEKEGNIVIVGNNAKFNEKTGRWEDVHKWPVPPQWLGIHNAIQEGVKSIVTGEAYDVAEHVGNVTENLTTVNPTDMTKTANNYIPQLVKLIAEPMTNTNFFTRDKIVPDSMQNLDAQDQKTKATSGVARVLGRLTGASPMQIDNTIRTGTGGAGQNVVWAVDKMLEATGAIGKGEGRGRNPVESVTDRFVGARGTSDGVIYFKTLDEAAKKNKLSGKDLSIFNSLVDQKMNGEGEIEGKDERDVLNKYQNLANNPRVAKTFAEAAKDRSRITGEPLDPLYKLTDDQQLQFYLMRSVPKESADQRHLENKNAEWYKPFTQERTKYYKALNLPPQKESNRVKYPTPSEELAGKLEAYFVADKATRGFMLDKNPDITKHFDDLAKYNNEVRKAQGFDPMRTYPQASDRVQKLLDAGNYKDPEVGQFMQDLNLYNLTSDAALAQIQGNSLSEKGKKAVKNLGYSIKKNDDGTYSLEFPDTQGAKQGNSERSDMGSTGNASGNTKSTGSRSSGGSRTGSRSSSGSSKANDGLDIDSAKLAMKLKVPETDKAPSVKATQMKKATLKKYQVVNGKRIPIKVSGKKRVA